MSRKLTRVEITPELIEDVIKEDQDMPDDAELVDFWLPDSGSSRRIYTAVMESSEFDEVLEAEIIPLFHEVDE